MGVSVRVGPSDRGLIYKLLHNRTYLGELRHKEQWYEGKHKAIIDQKLWDDVHSILATNAHKRGNYTRAKMYNNVVEPISIKRLKTCWINLASFGLITRHRSLTS
jgi:hypothetical protein